MNFENYKKEQRTIDMMKANLVAMKYLAFFAVLFGLPYLLIWKFESYSLFDIDNVVVEGSLPLLFLLIGIVLHELVHGIFLQFLQIKVLLPYDLG